MRGHSAAAMAAYEESCDPRPEHCACLRQQTNGALSLLPFEEHSMTVWRTREGIEPPRGHFGLSQVLQIKICGQDNAIRLSQDKTNERSGCGNMKSRIVECLKFVHAKLCEMKPLDKAVCILFSAHSVQAALPDTVLPHGGRLRA